MLKDWNGAVEVDGTTYNSIQEFINLNKLPLKEAHIKLYPRVEKPLKTQNTRSQNVVNEATEVQITVKPYMTKQATPDFDFMAKWNNNNPMPLRTMQGKRIKETTGMVYMELHGQGKQVIKCLRCGKQLTNSVSRHYGIGPECMGKLGFTCDINAVEEIKEKLTNVKWEGWIIKSSILEEVDV